jgi:t-SNARE complex subunit (syntaxin)
VSVLVEIRNRRQQISVLEEEIVQLQQLCSHPFEAVSHQEYRFNDEFDLTANYERAYHCEICDKRWTEKV